MRIGLFGGPLDTGNLGVSALGVSTLHGLLECDESLGFTLFDYGRGLRREVLEIGERRVPVRRVGCSYSRRVYRFGNLQQMRVAARLGLRRVQPVLAELDAADAVLDISGGDSFADLYGDWRFRSVSAPKQLALELGLPLVLLPQTYGPFAREANRATARRLVLGARQAWSRDPRSHAVLEELLGRALDPARHRCGVDVAFGLPARPPRDPELRRLVEGEREAAGVLLGLNVSGLLFHDPSAARARFGLRSDYPGLLRALLPRLLEDPRARLLLVPHVVPPCSADEADAPACEALRASLPAELAARVSVVPPVSDPGEAKWVVGRCDWFCGTRMHACIAGLSQGVPTASISYSDKSPGVFETAGVGDGVLDARALEVGEIVEGLAASVAEREARRRALAAARPGLQQRWSGQFEAILAAVRESDAGASVCGSDAGASVRESDSGAVAS